MDKNRIEKLLHELLFPFKIMEMYTIQFVAQPLSKINLMK